MIHQWYRQNVVVKNKTRGPGRCGSVGGSVVPQPNNHQFDSQSGHMQEATNQCFSHTDVSLFHPHLPFLSNENKKKKQESRKLVPLNR